MVKLGHLVRLLSQIFREVDLVLRISPVNGQRTYAPRIGTGTAISRMTNAGRRVGGQVENQLAG